MRRNPFLILAVLCTAFAASAQPFGGTPNAAPEPGAIPDTDALAALFALFGVSKAAGSAFLAKWVIATTGIRLFSNRLQSFIERGLASVISSKDTADDHVAELILRNPFYRFLAWCIDVATRLKLPLELPQQKETA